MAYTLKQAIAFIRSIANDAPDPDTGKVTFSDTSIVLALRAELFGMVSSMPEAFGKNMLTIQEELPTWGFALREDDEIDEQDFSIERDLPIPVGLPYIRKLQIQAYQLLNLRNQEGPRPELNQAAARIEES